MKNIGLKLRYGRRPASVVLISGLMLSMISCASKYGTQTVRTEYYAGCYAPIAQMRKDESTRTSNTVAGAIVGGLLGAAVGYSQDGGRGAVVGAAAGVIIGGSAAYLITDQIQKKDQAERFAAYSQALDQDIRGLDNAVAAAELVNRCYEDNYRKLKQDYQAGRIGTDEMRARLLELREGTHEANNVLAKFSDRIAKNQEVYQDIQRTEIQKGTNRAKLAVLTDKEEKIEQKHKGLQHEIQRMKTIAATMDNDYQTIHAEASNLRLAAGPAGLCRPMAM